MSAAAAQGSGVLAIQQSIQCADVRPRNQQLRIDDDIDMQWRQLAACLKLLHGPVTPRACFVDAIDPDVVSTSVSAVPS